MNNKIRQLFFLKYRIRETFEVARDMLRKILYSFNEKSPIMILCANMCDKDGRVITAKGKYF